MVTALCRRVNLDLVQVHVPGKIDELKRCLRDLHEASAVAGCVEKQLAVYRRAQDDEREPRLAEDRRIVAVTVSSHPAAPYG